jgi:hypothetical protein
LEIHIVHWLFLLPTLLTGAYAQFLAMLAGVVATMLQQSVYNGNYGGHGIKLQGLQLFDGMVMVYGLSLRRHDSAVLLASKLEDQLAVLHSLMNPVGTLPAQIRTPVAIGDKAYGNTEFIKSKSSRNRLNAMQDPAARAEATIVDDLNNP